MSRFIFLATVLALLCGSGVLSSAQGSDGYTWQGPYQVTVDPNQTYGFDPAVVHTTGGTYFALMAGTVSGTGGVFLISSTDGMNWGTPVYITSGWDECDIIQAQDGNLYAAISTGGGVQIWRGTSSGTGWSFWGQVVSIGGGQQYWAGSLTQAPDGTFYCSFMDHDGNSHHVYVSSSGNAASWSTKVLVPGPGSGQHYFDPNIMEIGGVLYVVYNSYYNYEMYMCKSWDKGATWTSPAQITSGASTSAHTGPSIAEGPGGTVVVAYGTGAKGLSILESMDGGMTWVESQAQPKGYTPSIIRAHDGRLWIIYADVVGPEWEIFTTRSSIYMPPLVADTYALPESTGGAVNFTLDAGAGNANRYYLIVGSVTGITPGIALPGGMTTLPVNWDPFTSLVIALVNTPAFANFMSQLDGSGKSTAQMNSLGPLPPGSWGLSMFFAYCMSKPFDFASNPVMVNIVP